MQLITCQRILVMLKALADEWYQQRLDPSISQLSKQKQSALPFQYLSSSILGKGDGPEGKVPC